MRLVVASEPDRLGRKLYSPVIKSSKYGTQTKRKNPAGQTRMSKTTVKKLGVAIVESFQELNPAQRAHLRRELYERVTGKVFRPN
jgi:hypothetical protein